MSGLRPAAWETWEITRGSWEELGVGGVCWETSQATQWEGLPREAWSKICQGQSRRILNQHQGQPLSKGCPAPGPSCLPPCSHPQGRVDGHRRPCRQDVTPLLQVQPPPYPPPHTSLSRDLTLDRSGGQTEVPRPTQFSWSHFKTLASPRRLEIQQTVLILQDKGLAAWGGGEATRGQEGAQDPARGPLRGGSAQLPKGLPTSTPGSPRDSKRSPRP